MGRFGELEQTVKVCKDVRSYTCLLVASFLAATVHGQEWARFRGPNGQGISNAKTIPIKWTEKDYNWKVKLPGGGHSSPVVWDGKVFVTCENRQPARGVLLALTAADGRILWDKQYNLTAYRHHRDNSYAVATPAGDANCVYVLWQTAGETIVAAVEHSGREVWQRSMPGVHSQYGPGSSPIVFHDMVVFTHEQEDIGGSYESVWVALDRQTGKTRWIVNRGSAQISYSTPCVHYTSGREPQLIFTSNAHGITGVDPAKGIVVWELQSALPDRVVSSPLVADDLVIATCGKGSAGKQLVAVRLGTTSSATQPSVAYTREGRLAPYVPTPLAKDGLLFTFHDQGYISCLRCDTGEVLWCEKPAGEFYGSPVWANGLLYCVTKKGDVVVVKAGSTYEPMAVNSLGETSFATPAVADGRMYLRTYSHLISIGGKTE